MLPVACNICQGLPRVLNTHQARLADRYSVLPASTTYFGVGGVQPLNAASAALIKRGDHVALIVGSVLGNATRAPRK